MGSSLKWVAFRDSSKLESLFRSPTRYGTLLKKDPKRDPTLKNYPCVVQHKPFGVGTFFLFWVKGLLENREELQYRAA